MRWLGIALAAAMVTSGCIGIGAEDQAQPTSASTPTTDESETWTQETSVDLGWIVAAGTHTAAGDTIVGVRSHDRCPGASFIVPAGASTVAISFDAPTVDDGIGSYTVAIGSPDAVTYLNPPASDPAFEDEDPVAGPWSIEVKPNGAALNQVWSFDIELEGEGPDPGALDPVKDRDCLL
jgi:hypothetical protein